MQNTARWILSWAFATLGLAVWFSSLRNQDMTLWIYKSGNWFTTQSAEWGVRYAAPVQEAPQPQEDERYETDADRNVPMELPVDEGLIRCQTQYVVQSWEPATVLVRAALYQDDVLITLPNWYTFYPQARINGPRNFIVSMNDDGEGAASLVPAGTYVAASALVGPDGELISCMPVKFEVSVAPMEFDVDVAP